MRRLQQKLQMNNNTTNTVRRRLFPSAKSNAVPKKSRFTVVEPNRTPAKKKTRVFNVKELNNNNTRNNAARARPMMAGVSVLPIKKGPLRNLRCKHKKADLERMLYKQ